MAEMKQRSLEEVKALSQAEAVEIVRHAGILARGRRVPDVLQVHGALTAPDRERQ